MNGQQVKVLPNHLERKAFVYVRQSSPGQVQNNRESQELQYGLSKRAMDLGWPEPAIVVVDEDLGLSGASAEKRTGFQRLAAEVALGQAGIVFGLEVSRLARNNSDWYHLLDLCAIFDTLIADGDGVYNPAHYNDRLLLGLKGTISEAELHVMRARLVAGRDNKARRGELVTLLPIGYRLGPDDEIVKEPDESIQHTIELVFNKFDELGSAQRVLRWLKENHVLFPRLPKGRCTRRVSEVVWDRPVYGSVYHLLTNPLYAGTYVFGRTRRTVKRHQDGSIGKRSVRLPVDQWEVLIVDHHEAYLSWDKFLKNQECLRGNRRMGGDEERSRAGRGIALLQGLVRCGACGRKMRTDYSGDGGSVIRYVCRTTYDMLCDKGCQSCGGRRIDEAVVGAFLEAVTPARVEASLEAIAAFNKERDSVRRHWELQIEKASFEAERARRQFHAAEPENRLVVRELERRWNERLSRLEEVKLDAEKACGTALDLDVAKVRRLKELGNDLRALWEAPSTTPEDRKQLLRTLIDEVVIVVDRDAGKVRTTIVWRGGHSTQFETRAPRIGHHRHKTGEEAIAAIRELAKALTDDDIASVLNKRGIRTGWGNFFTGPRVKQLRRHYGIPGLEPATSDVTVCNVAQAAERLGVSTATIHRWLASGWLHGVQPAPHAQWIIHITATEERRLKSTTAGRGLSITELSEWLRLPRKDVAKKIRSGEIPARRAQAGHRSRWIVDAPLNTAEVGSKQLELDCDS